MARADAVIARALAEVDLRWGGCGRRETVAGIAVGGGTSSSSCAVAQSGGASTTDRRFGVGTRVDESFPESQAFRTVVRGWSTLRQGCPTDTPGLRGVGRVDQRSELRPQECSQVRQHGDHHTVGNSVEPRHRTVVAPRKMFRWTGSQGHH